MDSVYGKVKKAKNASLVFSCESEEKKNRALKAIASAILERSEKLFEANEKDLNAAEKLLSEGNFTEALVKRLKLDRQKISEISDGVLSVAKQEKAVGKTLSCTELDSGLELFKVTVPIGVICCIFESRPDALVQIASLAIKSGNAVILKGGSEAANTNRFLFELIRDCLKENNLPEEIIQLIEMRSDVKEILGLDNLIDLIIPRGSNEFVKFIQDNTRIPVLGHASGICSVFVDEDADLEKAEKICFDAKTQYPAVCNAMETMIVHSDIALDFLPVMGKKFVAAGVKLFADEISKKIFSKNNIPSESAGEKNFATEYNDLVLNVKVVKGIDEAIEHINKYGSKHTDSIVTENRENALKFINMVDASSVMWNSSTRFADGYRYGLGSEVGINTGKIHSRGPSGLDSLLTYKYILVGSGNIVADYSGKNAKRFLHRHLEKKWSGV